MKLTFKGVDISTEEKFVSYINSISWNLTASSVVAFADTHKQVYVSRYYYKPLINKLEEKRLHQ